MSGSVGLHAPSYTARLLYLSGGDLQVDDIQFYTVVPVEHPSWGVIKSMYGD